MLATPARSLGTDFESALALGLPLMSKRRTPGLPEGLSLTVLTVVVPRP